MDGTLIKTKSGLVFPKDYDDWQLIYPDVPKKLHKLHNDGYKIVIFTNQGSIGSGKLNPKFFKNKLKNIIQKIRVPIQVYFFFYKFTISRMILHVIYKFICRYL